MKSQPVFRPERLVQSLSPYRTSSPYLPFNQVRSNSACARQSPRAPRKANLNPFINSINTLATAAPLFSSRRYASSVPKPETTRLLDQFNVQGRVVVVTGGGRGLGLTMAEGIAEAGGKGMYSSIQSSFLISTYRRVMLLVYCLDRLPEPDDEFKKAAILADSSGGGSLHYERVDVCNDKDLAAVLGKIGSENDGIHGLIAAAGVQQLTAAVEYTREDINKMLDINYTGVFMSATAVAKQMMKFNCEGSIILVGSMSGFIANKGLISPVYNSSKAAVIQLARSLAMEWGKLDRDGGKSIRVNSLCPGHIITPMVKKNFAEVPGLKETWEKENMMGRLASPDEFKGAALFLLSNASSFMTGSSLVIDAGHTAW
jgi:NAD(P)-dependent dehydrogenase (short-subunit alcohol dehydrogenase family)